MAIKTIVTHNARFHADDVFAAATLRECFGDEPTITRTRDQATIDAADLVIDVGSVYDPATMRFDHHQAGRAGARANGIEYASFGLVWKQFGNQVTGSQEITDAVDQKLVQAIDAADNGVELYQTSQDNLYPYTIQTIISSYNPTWKEDDAAADKAFVEMVAFARGVIRREIVQATHFLEAKSLVESAYQKAEDKHIVVIEKNYPWMSVLAGFPEPLYVIRPDTQTTNWKVECVRDNPMRYENRKPLPQEWGGKRDDVLVEATGVADAIFCHTGRFLIVSASKEGALELAKKAVAA